MVSTARKYLYILFSIIGVVAISLAAFIITRGEFISASPTELFDCGTIQFSNEGAINLVFFGSEQESTEYFEYLMDSDPYKNYNENFNAYFIKNFIPRCEIYRGEAFLCHSQDVIRAAASCPNDYLIVLKNGPSEIRSSAYKSVLSINTAHPKTVLLHEFGHAFANLAEEYVPGKIPSGSQNCQSSCDGFTSEIDSCHESCSESNYFRSIRAGVMRTLSTANYGIFDDNLIANEINSQSNLANPGVTGNAISDPSECSTQEYYYAIFDQVTGEEIGKRRGIGCAPTQKRETDSRYIFTSRPGTQPAEDGVIEIDGPTFESEIEIIVQQPIGENTEDETVEFEIVTSAVIQKEVEGVVSKDSSASPTRFTIKKAIFGTSSVETSTASESSFSIDSILSSSSTSSEALSPLEGDTIDKTFSGTTNVTNSTNATFSTADVSSKDSFSSDSSTASFQESTITAQVISAIPETVQKSKAFSLVLLIAIIATLIIIIRKNFANFI